MRKEEWQKGLDAWNNMRKQAIIDQELSELIIDAITKKMGEIPEEKEDGK